MHPIVLVILLAGALFYVGWYNRATPARRRQLRGRLVMYGGLALLLLLVLRGGMHPLLAVLGAAIPIAYRVLNAVQLASGLRSQWRQWSASQGPSPGRKSTVRTAYVEMELDHDSGAMDGLVLAGKLEGRRLSTLDLDALCELWAEVAGEPQSAALLEAYLDRTHGDGWREQAGVGADARGPGAPTDGQMSPAEAREILGLGPEPTRRDIIDAHRRLMQKLHPDRGGSTYLAAKVNAAKDVLLGR